MNKFADDYGVAFHARHSEARRLRRAEALATLAAPLPKRTTARLRPAERHAMALRSVAVALVVVTAWVAAWVVAFAW